MIPQDFNDGKSIYFYLKLVLKSNVYDIFICMAIILHSSIFNKKLQHAIALFSCQETALFVKYCYLTRLYIVELSIQMLS